MDEEKLHFEPELVLKLKGSMQEAGWKTELVERTASPEFQRKSLEVLLGESEIIPVELSINLDREPYLPTDWRRLRHQTFGREWKWEPLQLELYFSEEQRRDGGRVWGKKLVKRIQKTRRPLNACALDYLRRHRKYLPDAWFEWLKVDKRRTICFVGTTYANQDGFECVRCLCLDAKDQLIWNSRKLKEYWDGNDVVVLMIP